MNSLLTGIGIFSAAMCFCTALFTQLLRICFCDAIAFTCFYNHIFSTNHQSLLPPTLFSHFLLSFAAMQSAFAYTVWYSLPHRRLLRRLFNDRRIRDFVGYKHRRWPPGLTNYIHFGSAFSLLHNEPLLFSISTLGYNCFSVAFNHIVFCSRFSHFSFSAPVQTEATAIAFTGFTFQCCLLIRLPFTTFIILFHYNF